MDTEIKKQWVKALRSGRYRQARETLVNKSGTAFCCLGVLAKIQGCSVAAIREQQNSSDAITLPTGFNARLPVATRQRLADMNDGMSNSTGEKFPPKSFKEIADYIEKKI